MSPVAARLRALRLSAAGHNDRPHSSADKWALPGSCLFFCDIERHRFVCGEYRCLHRVTGRLENIARCCFQSISRRAEHSTAAQAPARFAGPKPAAALRDRFDDSCITCSDCIVRPCCDSWWSKPMGFPMQACCLFEQSRECEIHAWRDVAPENNDQESRPATRPLLLIDKSKRRRGEIAYSASLVNVDFTP